MKKIIIAVVFLFMGMNFIHAQCKSIDLNTLQELQNLPSQKKETKVLDLGFSLEPGQSPAAANKMYGKCFGPVGNNKDGFYQVITLNAEKNTINFSTYGKKNYLSIRKAIEDSPNYRFSHKLADGSDQFESKAYKVSFLVGENNFSITLGNLN